MRNPRLAGRYAKSLLGLSLERGELETVYADMLWLKSVCDNSREFVNLLRSPIIKADKKEKILGAVIGGKVSALTTAFINLLVTKNRESHMPEIITAFIGQYKEYKNIHIIKLTTAVPLTDDLKSQIIARVKDSSDMQNIELETNVDENLIGGFVLQAGDKLVDASIAYDLKHIARQFENNDFIYKVR